MKFRFLIYIVLFLLYSCEQTSSRIPNENQFGGTLKINEPALFKTLFPHSLNDQISYQLISQIYDGLVKFDAFDLSVKPAIASSWKIDSTETIYTFYLNNNVYFHDDACFTDGIGRKVTANDFVYSFTLLSTEDDHNLNFYGTIDYVVGAQEHYLNNTTNISGLTAVDDTTLRIELKKPNPLFLYRLASPIASVIPKEAFESYKYRSYIGTGPFFVSNFPLGSEPLILERNPYYYKKDKSGKYLPYLDSVIVTFNSSVIKELSLLKKGELDMVFNINNNDLSFFLEKNIQLFKGKSPLFILQLSNYNQDQQLQHILKRNLKGFITNSQNYFDLSKIYFEKSVQDSLLSHN